jgi:hypothetical protein
MERDWLAECGLQKSAGRVSIQGTNCPFSLLPLLNVGRKTPLQKL